MQFEEPATPPAAQAARQSRHILVVDDNQDAADSVSILLTLDGHGVETALIAALSEL